MSREIYNIIDQLKLKIKPFYMVGGMGHTSSVVSLRIWIKK
jgi:hypothetical protein